MGTEDKTNPPSPCLPLEGRAKISHPLWGRLCGRSSDSQAWPVNMTSVSTNPSSRFRRKPVVIGCSILLTAAGQSRIRTGFPLGAPPGSATSKRTTR